MASAGLPPQATAQDHDGVAVHGSAVLVGTSVHPGFAGKRLTEGYVTQPNIMAHVAGWSGRVAGSVALNLEPFTLRRGELNPGIWGEGYVDRRHPHTLSHEVMLTLSPHARERPLRAALSVGKGFVPFGTDDPMTRPFIKFPVNHHLAQLLERAQVIAAVGSRFGALEAAWFNGDEPASPTGFANLSRVGDSWAARATAWVGRTLELSTSFAAVASPEVPDGSGIDQRKWNSAARFAGRPWQRGELYALIEYSHTRDYDDEHPGLAARSTLAESSYELDPNVRVALRLERTERLEEERLLDPFRSPRPHYDAHQLGTTLWEAATVNVTLTRSDRWRPFVEVARLRASERPGPSLFDPAVFYGSNLMWSFSAGARLELGHMRRMGRYGPASRPSPGHHPPRRSHE